MHKSTSTGRVKFLKEEEEKKIFRMSYIRVFEFLYSFSREHLIPFFILFLLKGIAEGFLILESKRGKKGLLPCNK